MLAVQALPALPTQPGLKIALPKQPIASDPISILLWRDMHYSTNVCHPEV